MEREVEIITKTIVTLLIYAIFEWIRHITDKHIDYLPLFVILSIIWL